MSVTANQIRSGFYLDSVALMRLSVLLKDQPGVTEAALMIGSDSNKALMRDAELLGDSPEVAQAGPNDLIVGVRATSQALAEQALTAAARLLTESASAGGDGAGGETSWQPRSLAGAREQLPDANLALISVPGEFAAREAQQALEHGLNVMLFSDNVPPEQELALKQQARDNGLIVMGPDCGTALIHGQPLAFANAVSRGAIGAIAASGTGLQEFSVLLTRLGAGLSHGLGVGGRDLSDAIGAISTLTALDWLEADPATERIVLISKPPGPETAARVLARLQHCPKPVIACFLGLNIEAGAITLAPTLRAAAELAAGQTLIPDAAFSAVSTALQDNPTGESPRRWLRGLFSGGTLCAEAQLVLLGQGITVHSNAPVPGATALSSAAASHRLLDLGADEYTRGRPHPMLEPAVRAEALAEALNDSAVKVILLDLVLGYGAHPDPAAGVIRTLDNAGGGERPTLIASVCGTDADPQNAAEQAAALRDAGVIVAPSNAHAAELAAALVAGNPP